MNSIFSFTAEKSGRTIALKEFNRNVALIVNTASLCSFTQSNIAILNQVYTDFAHKGFAVLAFPCSQFANQEPLMPDELTRWASDLAIKFPVFDPIYIKGTNTHPLYAMLQRELGRVRWNYTKYICDRNGIPYRKLDAAASSSEVSALISHLI